MSERVIANHMAGFGDLARKVGPLLDVAADKKKCGLHIVSGQHFQ